MAPLAIFATLAGIMALSTSVTAQSGTGTGLPIASPILSAPYPLSNATLPYGPTGTGIGTATSLTTGNGSPSATPLNLLGTGSGGLFGGLVGSGTSCPAATTVTTTKQVTVTVTVPASSVAASTTPAFVPYPIPGSSGSPVRTGTGTGYGTETGTGYATATGYAKRMDMRGLKRERKERKRGIRFW